MPRYALIVDYDGSAFQGWQVQPHGPSVQAALEAALSQVCDCDISVVCAGRTDSGVHGLGQVVHVDVPSVRSPRALMLGANTKLPVSVGVRFCREVPDNFHARYSALARVYRYQLVNHSARPGGLRARDHAWERLALDVDRMQQAAQALLGEHDFSSFRALSCQARRPWRRMDVLQVQRQGERVIFDLQANAFLHHMVRNIVGSLLQIGVGKYPPEWLHEVLLARDRTQAGPTAQAQGLSFIGPRYAAHWGLPDEFAADPALLDWRPHYAGDADDAE
jgi:tRNA pseudouridine38-40 synthase